MKSFNFVVTPPAVSLLKP